MNTGVNGSAMGPHGLIFDEDGAISCPMPLNAFPTPFMAVLNPFWSILGGKGVDRIVRIFFFCTSLCKAPPPPIGVTAGLLLLPSVYT